MARARAHAAEQAARAGKFNTVLDSTRAEILAALAAGIDAQAPESPRPETGAPSADELLDLISRRLDGGCR